MSPRDPGLRSWAHGVWDLKAHQRATANCAGSMLVCGTAAMEAIDLDSLQITGSPQQCRPGFLWETGSMARASHGLHNCLPGSDRFQRSVTTHLHNA